MANKLPSREDLFSTFDSVDSAPDYSKAVGSLMLENQKTSSKLRRWSIFFLIILLLLAALAAAAFQSMYQNYRSNQTIAQIKEDPLGEVKVDSSDIAADSIEFDQLDSALQARIVNIDNSVTNLGGQVASTNESIENQPPDAGGTVTNVSTGAGLTGGPITGAGLIAVRAPTCTSNQRLSWDGANFRCVGVLGTGTVGQNTFFAGPTSGSGAPSYRAIVAGDLSGAISSTGPITYNDTTGDISCPTCITSVGTAFVASADSGSDQPLNIGDTLSLLGGDGISTVASLGNEVTFNLTDTGITPATYGSASSVPTFTVDSKGRLTGASSTTISGLTSSNLSGSAAITNAQLQNSALTISSGNGLTGGGSISLGGSSSLAISAPTCLSSQRLSWNGSAFICSAVAGTGSEAANTFFAGPTSGGATTPTFRGIVTADLGSGTANNQSFLRGDQTWFQLLDGGGKIDSSLLPSNGLNLQGSWNANTNSPTLADGGTGGVQGDFYIVNTAGTTSVDGSSTWNIGDWILHNGTT